MSNNNFQQFQGYGVPQYDPNQWDVAAQVAALPDTGLTNKFINTAMPEGQMISGHYVAPSWSQNLAAGLKQGMGGQMYSEGTKARNAMVKLLRDRSKNLGADSMSGLTGEGGVGVTEDQRY